MSKGENKIPQSLQGLLAPVSMQDFLHLYWGKAFMRLPGPPEKLQGLFPWNHLNDVLAHYRLNPPRMRLVKEGAAVKPGAYLQIVDGKPRSVRAPDFTRLLTEGATLIIDEAEELHAPLRNLVVSLERIFRSPIQANLYAGWRTNKGFNLHWDSHDVLVLQIAGQKSWKVYEPTRDFPLRDDYETAPPPEKLAWEGILHEGELLYMPRGWWHVACPLDEPCLHITLGLRNHTGMDLVRWFADSLEETADFRRDLPHWSGLEEKAAHVEKLKQGINQRWTSDLVDRFFAAKDLKAASRSYFFLPAAASPAGVFLPDDGVVRLAAPRLLRISHDREQGVLHFQMGNRKWQCTDLLSPFFQLLNEGQACSIRRLLAVAPGLGEVPEVRACLQEMILEGLLVIESEISGQEQQEHSLNEAVSTTADGALPEFGFLTSEKL
jgi:ribosomal protein L16 Arg81 hydroxylase